MITISNTQIRRALRIWHRNASEETPFDHLCLFNHYRLRGYSVRRATNQVLFDGLEKLHTRYPKDANLLRQRFVDGRTVRLLLNTLNVGDTKFFSMQKKAIGRLAEVLTEMEAEEILKRDKRLNQRLPPPTSYHLVGVEIPLTELRNVLLTKAQTWVVCIAGLGGIGKTSLTHALVGQLIRQGLFEDFGWVSAQQQVLNLGGGIQRIDKPALTVDALVEALVEELLGLTPAQLSGKQAFNTLQERLKTQPHLIVIDNLETVKDVESLLPTLRRLANPSQFLLTTRRSLFTEPDVYHFAVPELSEQHALELIRQEAEQRNLPHVAFADDETLLPVYERVGGNPLALRLVVGQTHIHHLSMVLNDLPEARGESVENLYTYIYRRAWDNLDEETRALLLGMPLVTEQGGTFKHMEYVTQLAPSALRKSLYLLVSLSLVDVRHHLTESHYSIHNLTRTFLQKQVADWL